jgi:hypothetical protein
MHVAIIADDLTGAADTAQMVAAVVRPLTISQRVSVKVTHIASCNMSGLD